jgi:hypothetical protein
VLQTCTDPVAPVPSAQAGIQFDAANPATVTEAAFKNSLREPLAIYIFPFSRLAECLFEGQPNSKTVNRLGQLVWS